MFKALMKVQLASVIASLMRSSKGNEKRSAASGALIAVLFVFVAGVLVFAFGAMFYALAAPMHSVGLDWFYFAMAALTAFALCFIGSVFTAQQQLFSARDNELLLAMPIKPKFILGSRMVMLLAIDYALELLVMAPAAVIWGVQVGYSAAGVAALVVGILLLPLLVLGIHLNIHRHNYFAWKERVCSTGPWAGPSVWAGEGDDIYLVSREDGRGGCEVTAYLAAEGGCEELRATMSEGVRTLFQRDGEGHSVYMSEFDVRGDVMTIDGLTDAAGNAALGETSLVRMVEGQAAKARGR